MVFDFEAFQSRHIGPDPEETAAMDPGQQGMFDALVRGAAEHTAD